MVLFISIDYEEAKGDKYKGVVISSRKDEVKRFFTNDVVEDWKNMTKFCVENPSMYMFSSSVDHFVMDVDGFQWSVDESGNDVIVREQAPVPGP